MTLARHRLEHLTLQRDHLFRVRRANNVGLRLARHELQKVQLRAEREQDDDLVAFMKLALAVVDDAVEHIKP